LTYLWNDIDNTTADNITTLDTEQGYVLALEYLGCQSEVAKSIAIHDASTLSMSSDDEVCHGMMADLRFDFTGASPWALTLADAEGRLLFLTGTEEQLVYQKEALDDIAYEIISATDVNGCDIHLQGGLSTKVRPELTVYAGDDRIIDCRTTQVELEGQMDQQLDNYAITWTSLEGHNIEQYETMYPLISEAGYYVIEIVDNDHGCVAQDTMIVTKRTSFDLTVAESQIYLDEGESVALSALVSIPDAEVASILWAHDGSLDCDDCMSTVATPTASTVYTVTIEDIYGCVEIREIELVVRELVEDPHKIYIPNTFDPSASGADKAFRVFGNDNISEIISLGIYDRWGSEVFRVNEVSPDDPSASWDGRFGGRSVASGVYIYHLTLLMDDGIEQSLTGTITLM